MSTAALGAPRPVGVTVIAVIAFIQATIAIIAGIGFIVERNSDTLLSHVDVSSDSILGYGIGAIIWGVVALFVALGLWRGQSWSRVVVAIVEALAVAGGIYLLFAWSGHYLWQGIWQILVALFVLYLLFNPRADEFFHGRHPA